jgi:protein tyrosine phosphatase (PTP) superfamily phosphohydrolase (DUF442 family)
LIWTGIVFGATPAGRTRHTALKSQTKLLDGHCMRLRKRYLAIFALAGPLSLLLYFGLLQASGNFHAVEAGRFYRSAQPGDRELAAYAQTLGIKSVINLRGAHPGEAWYDDEMRASERLGLRHFDIKLSARRELTLEQFSTLETALRQAPAPVLVHCKSGADRTGLASALYALEVQHLPPEAAAGQLSWVYGHWPYFWSQSGAMDRSFERAVKLRFATPGDTEITPTSGPVHPLHRGYP